MAASEVTIILLSTTEFILGNFNSKKSCNLEVLLNYEKPTPQRR